MILAVLVRKGYRQFNVSLFTRVAPTSMEAMLARISDDPLPGGILNGLTGSLLILSVAILMAIPTGILAGVYLAEKQDQPLAWLVRNLSDLLQGLPSIVVGVIVYISVVRQMS